MKEIILQKLWINRLHQNQTLVSTDGTKIYVVHPGEYNTGDGPDFKGAKIMTNDGLTLFGDIEIHVKEQDWYEHKHHRDSRYNSVILHVVLESCKLRAETQNGYRPLTIVASPYLQLSSESVQSDKSQWPCTSAIHYISEDVITKQFEKAKREYFDTLVKRLMSDWDPTLTLSEAWKTMLILTYADGLGISKNRDAMRFLASEILKIQRSETTVITESFAIELAGLCADSSSVMHRLDWDFSGSRPGNRPEKRIPALVHFIKAVQPLTPSSFRNEPLSIWAKSQKSHNSRTELLFYLCYLPSLYLLGDVLFDTKLQSKAYQLWSNQKLKPELVLRKPFYKAGFPSHELPDHLGTVYQLKQYCRQKNCESCTIYKATRSEMKG